MKSYRAKDTFKKISATSLTLLIFAVVHAVYSQLLPGYILQLLSFSPSSVLAHQNSQPFCPLYVAVSKEYLTIRRIKFRRLELAFTVLAEIFV